MRATRPYRGQSNAALLAVNQAINTVSSPDVAGAANRPSEPNKSFMDPDPTSLPQAKSSAWIATTSRDSSSENPVLDKVDVAFISAAGYGNTKDLERWFQAGAKIDARDYSGRSALHLAAYVGQFENAQWLLERGTDKLSRDYAYNTALHIACGQGHMSVVDLLGGDSNVSLRGLNGDTPLHVASSKDYDGVVCALLAYGADVNARNDGGQTPLHLAARSGSISVARVLLDAGADLKAVDRMSLTAHRTAISHQNSSVAAFLDRAEKITPETPQPSLDPNQLPMGWEQRQERLGRSYYVDNNTRTTSWHPPNVESAKAQREVVNSNTGSRATVRNDNNLRVTGMLYPNVPWYMTVNHQITL
jgi:hypothetical protein